MARPFAGTTRADLIANVTRGRLREVPRQSRVPAWVRAVLVRGLAVGPSERFATTDALLSAPESDPSRRRRRVMLVGASVLTLVVIAAGVEGTRRYQRARAVAGCEAAGAAIDEVWNADVPHADDDRRRTGKISAQAGEAKLREVILAVGFKSVRRATETPFNRILEARP